MPEVPSQEIEFTDEDGDAYSITYLFHPHHRNNNPKKSQWEITEDAESDSFIDAWENDWVDDQEGWGLHVEDDNAVYLGVGIDRSVNLFIAKFVCKNNQDEWHGYPADHTRNSDRPSQEVLELWLEAEFLPAAKISKITQGKRCTL